jgi:2-polyprenyl-3-methyl-5-hydroxy-6-metoxy-1,4-benzoquinol methylase
MTTTESAYRWTDAKKEDSHSYLLPTLISALQNLNLPAPAEKRVFDLGCGNGSIGHELSKLGWQVTGVDPSREGILHANRSYPNLALTVGSAYDDLAERHGQFSAVVSMEVVEHVYFPRKWASTLFDLVIPGGTAIVSTPYHGYFKNLVMAATGTLDKHFTALWDHGHIKFWSVDTLGQLLTEAGFVDIRFHRVGRIPPLAKSMVVVCKRQ